MSITLHYPEIEVLYKIRNVQSNFCVVNPDYDQKWNEDEVPDPRYSYHVSRVTRNRTAYHAVSKSGDDIGKGAPATARFVYHNSFDNPEYVEFTEPFQKFIHAINSERSGQSEELNKKSFASLFRDNVMMSDFAGTWSRADYINNNGMPPYIMLKPMVCGGSLLKIVGEMNIGNAPHWLVEGMTNENFEGYHPSTHPHLFFCPVISIRKWYFDTKGSVILKEEHYAEPFPQYNSNAILPVLGVKRDERSSTGWVNAIQKHRTRVLQKGESVPNPFIIRYGRIKPNPYEGFTS